jgi:hypothetical protein
VPCLFQHRGPDRTPALSAGMSTSPARACSAAFSAGAVPGGACPRVWQVTRGWWCWPRRGYSLGCREANQLDEHTWVDSVRATAADADPELLHKPAGRAGSRIGAPFGLFSTSPLSPDPAASPGGSRTDRPGSPARQTAVIRLRGTVDILISAAVVAAFRGSVTITAQSPARFGLRAWSSSLTCRGC